MINIIHMLLATALIVSCSDRRQQQEALHSEESEPATETQPQEKQTEEMFYFTSDFQDHESLKRLHVRLRSADTDNSYIVPPVEYGSIQTQHALINGYKVNSGCVAVPNSSFPLWVDICQTEDCEKARRLGKVMQPNHYQISGVGGLIILQIYPQPPCSEHFIMQIQNVDNYVDVNELVP